MVEQKHDNAAEEEARNEENRQETERLLKRYRHEILAPSNMLGFLTVYLLFIAAVAGFGEIAFYSGHLITLRIVFFVCIPLLLIVPLGVTWYLRVLLPRNPKEKGTIAKQGLLDKIKQSSLIKSVVRLGNDRSFRLFNLALYTAGIFFAIRSFPVHPQFFINSGCNLHGFIFCICDPLGRG
jgi:hypothetical protein